jgi:hypothetical protein
MPLATTGAAEEADGITSIPARHAAKKAIRAALPNPRIGAGYSFPMRLEEPSRRVVVEVVVPEPATLQPVAQEEPEPEPQREPAPQPQS